jgi:integrase
MTMASIINRPDGHKWIQFTAGKRKTLRLGRVPMEFAKLVCSKVERIVSYRAAKMPNDPELSAWLIGISADLRKRLASAGLAEKPKATEMETFLSDYIASLDKAEGTITNNKIAADRLYAYFGRDKDIRTITTEEADNWATWFRAGFADSTSGREIRRVKHFFAVAVRRKIIVDNPFSHLKGTGDPDESRNAYIDRDTSTKIMAACPSLRWRLIFALARFGGLRTPSEMASLTWDMILWDESAMMVMDSKKGKLRKVPIGPDLRPLLDEAWAKPGESPKVLPDVTAKTNLGTTMDKIVIRAGLTPWAKTFVNLRASCETDWMDEFPVHVASAWTGNSPAVALKHYARMKQQHLDRASRAKAVQPSTSEQEPKSEAKSESK